MGKNDCRGGIGMLAKVCIKYDHFHGLFWVSVVLAVFIGFLPGTGCTMLHAAQGPTKRVVTQEEIQCAIKRATTYLVRANDQNGRFTYKVDLLPAHHRFKPQYNIIRHAGAMYALAQAWHQVPDERDNVRAALRRSARFLIAHCMAPIPGHADMLGIWSLPAVTHRKGPAMVKLGGAGLGLAALISTEKIVPNTISRDDLHRIGRFLLFMQNSDGRFATRYIPSRRGKRLRPASLYYPGEAALGLLMLYQLDHSPQWLTAAAKGLRFLIKNRDIITSDPWSLIACAKLVSLSNYPEKILPRHEVIAYARNVSLAIIEEQILYGRKQQIIGGFNKQGRTTPTATRVEALFAILDIIGRDDAMLRNTIQSSIRSAIKFLLDAQITQGKYAGGIPRVTRRLPVRKKSEQRRAGEIRIDYVQHMLSALLKCAENKESCESLH